MKKEVKKMVNDKIDANKYKKWQKPCPKQPEKAVYTVNKNNIYGFRRRGYEIHLN